MNFIEENLYNKIVRHIDDIRVRQEIYSQIAMLPFCMQTEEFEELLKLLYRYPDGVEALKNNWRIILNNAKRPIQILDIYKQNNEIAKQVLADIPYVIEYANIDDAGIIAKAISSFENGKKAISVNFEIFLRESYSNLALIFSSALEDTKRTQDIKDNLDILQLHSKDFLKFIPTLKDKKEFEKEYKKYAILSELYDSIKVEGEEEFNIDEYGYCNSQISTDSLYKMNKRDVIFRNILRSEDLDEKLYILETVTNGNKCEYKTIGNDSIIFQVGDQIIKLGEDLDEQFEIPYHPRLMMPYFRKKYKDRSVLEVYNLGNAESIKITDEELLEIYKELEEAGILWGDARKDNLLVLLSDNVLPDFIKSKDFNLFGFMKDEKFPTTNHKVLKKGEVVICDLYFLFAKGDPNYKEGCLDQVILDYINKKDRLEDKREYFR